MAYKIKSKKAKVKMTRNEFLSFMTLTPREQKQNLARLRKEQQEKN